eukprot:Nitzschia sp. Nitz4//scaffold5_size260463//34487//35392//NITZ4_000945-RA/size260463-processed-gene-0.111-mRNA-1//-1//CDS//3329555229//3456//frame0
MMSRTNIANTAATRKALRSMITRFQSTSTVFESPEPILDPQAFQDRLLLLSPSIANGLATDGYWTNFTDDRHEDILDPEVVRAIRQQSIALRDQGRYEQSYSEKTDANGEIVRFNKDGVYACEPDGGDYETAPDMLIYMSTLITTLPTLLNQVYHPPSERDVPLHLSNQSFNAKLAVTLPGASYPLHIDNTLGIQGLPTDDSRKLTCVLYLNPDHEPTDGGDIRFLLLDNRCIDLSPVGGRLAIFWSDDIPHEVLPCDPSTSHERYALTIWIPDMDPRNVQSASSKFESLRDDAFQGETWC